MKMNKLEVNQKENNFLKIIEILIQDSALKVL